MDFKVDPSRKFWDEYFSDIAQMVSCRSTCLRRQVGALAVKDKRILATGYNGAPSGLKHCHQVGCLRQQNNIPSGQMHELCRGLHAEQNVIIQAAIHGISLDGSCLYITTTPCSICAKMIINCRFVNVFVPKGEYYADQTAVDLLTEAGIGLNYVLTKQI